MIESRAEYDLGNRHWKYQYSDRMYRRRTGLFRGARLHEPFQHGTGVCGGIQDVVRPV